MKFVYAMMLLVFLASCTKAGVEAPVSPEASNSGNTAEVAVDEALVNDIVSEVQNIAVSAENEVQTLDVSYKDPAGTTQMKIEYALNADNTIESIHVIHVAGTDGFIKGFEVEAQKLVGKTLSDAENFYVAGSSLTSEAFSTAIKNI